MLVSAVTWLFEFQNVYATGIGEQRTVTLSDGSTVELNSQSRLRVAFHPHERDVELLEGRALFHVAHDRTRPFLAQSEGAKVRAVGTQFDVYRKSDGTVITVVEGRVAVMPESSWVNSVAPSMTARLSTVAVSSTEVLLSAGEQLSVTRRRSPQPVPVDAAVATSWTQHKIVFRHTPLAEAFAELNRYGGISLRIQGKGLEDFRISGTYATTDPTLLVTFLRQQPGLSVQEMSNVVVVAQAEQSRTADTTAQSSAPERSSRIAQRETESQVEEIVVTAQKKSERLQDVPVSVTVLSPDVLAQNGQVLLRDYAASVPGLSVSPFPESNQTVTIRGITTGGFTTPSVGLMIDDAPFGPAFGSAQNDWPDIDPAIWLEWRSCAGRKARCTAQTAWVDS
jgi:ferric-dicitrate binding protein FerR (iron transport regulator)